MEDFKVNRDFCERDLGVTFDEKGRPIYFAQSVQVKFLDTGAEEPTWIGGIALGDHIICGCCGGVISLEDFWDEVEEGWQNDPAVVNVADEDALVIFSDWVDISDAITG